jgi:uncharacterized cupredoxin-like copper-binding protein
MEREQKRSARSALLSVLGIIAITGLTACGGTAAVDVQPTATIAIVQPAPTATLQAQITVDATATVAVPEAAATATSEPGMTMDEVTATVEPEATATTATAQAEPDATATTAIVQATPTQGSGTETELQATLREWAIDLSQSEVPAGKVKITVTNQGQMMHNLTIQDSTGTVAQTPNFSSRQGSQTLEVELQPGTYRLLCSLPGHAQRGQITQLVVK